MTGIIEVTPTPASRRPTVDDTTLDRLLTSFAGFPSLADEAEAESAASGEVEEAAVTEMAAEQATPLWQRVSDSVYDGRMSVTADLAALMRDLELEYERVRHSQTR